jgi:hypothetical protein
MGDLINFPKQHRDEILRQNTKWLVLKYVDALRDIDPIDKHNPPRLCLKAVCDITKLSRGYFYKAHRRNLWQQILDIDPVKSQAWAFAWHYVNECRPDLRLGESLPITDIDNHERICSIVARFISWGETEASGELRVWNLVTPKPNLYDRARLWFNAGFSGYEYSGIEP